MGNVGKAVSRGVLGAATLGLSEVTGLGQAVTGGPKTPSPTSDEVKIAPVTEQQKQELADQEYNKQRKSKVFTTLLTQRAQRQAGVATLQPSLDAGSLKKTLG